MARFTQDTTHSIGTFFLLAGTFPSFGVTRDGKKNEDLEMKAFCIRKVKLVRGQPGGKKSMEF